MISLDRYAGCQMLNIRFVFSWTEGGLERRAVCLPLVVGGIDLRTSLTSTKADAFFVFRRFS